MPHRSPAHPQGHTVPQGSGLSAAADAVVLTSVDLRSPEAADAVADLALLAHDVLVAAAARRPHP